ncbi:MAG TPA: NAD(P) transhydrogenase subunit alpha [Actinoplanes sp.]|nr:NAD(P) transhydrogenase subunit alpha [Actinoplanes sp.]
MTTTIGVVRETGKGERRVALTPDSAQRLTGAGFQVLVENDAGQQAWFSDAEYAAAGATLRPRSEVLSAADALVCIGAPPEAAQLRAGQLLIGLLNPLTEPDLTRSLAAAGVTAISLDLLPRTLSRAQSMDVLTSQANVAGYKAVLLAAEAYAGFFPMLMTAAGTTRPAQVLVLGAGVAGLQAIATARRLGALVTGYDVREAAKADLASTGATVLELPGPAGTGAGGYARALTADETRAQQEALNAAIGRFDVVITTAQVPGRRPPELVSAAALDALRPGSVVIDLAAGPHGGNVAGSVADETVVTAAGVTVIGAGNLPASVPRAASTAYARNVSAVLACLYPGGVRALDLADEIQGGLTVTHDGQIVHPRVLAAIEEENTP